MIISDQVVRGKTNTFIQLDEDEAKKVQSHGDAVVKKLQKIHKSVIWNFLIGRSFVDKVSGQPGKSASEEVNIDNDENLEFDPMNPKVSLKDLDRTSSLKFDPHLWMALSKDIEPQRSKQLSSAGIIEIVVFTIQYDRNATCWL